jgi:hypothetical protein
VAGVTTATPVAGIILLSRPVESGELTALLAGVAAAAHVDIDVRPEPWPGAMPAHQGHVRLRGRGGDDRVVELRAMTEVARAILADPAALAYVNPIGETVRDRAAIEQSLARHDARGIPPLDLWTSVRQLDRGDGWSTMDTVGMAQLGAVDHEACFVADRYLAGDIEAFLRNVSIHLVRRGDVIGDGDTVDGPGGVAWRAHRLQTSLRPPARPVLRWFAEDGAEAPEALSVVEEE